MHKDFFKVLELARDSGNKVILFTNGTMITEQNYKRICECCDEIQLSFEGISEPYFNKVRGPGNFKKVMTALNLLKSFGMRVVLAITLLPMTIADVKNNLIDFVQSLEYDNMKVRFNHKIEFTGNAKHLNMSNYDEKLSNEIALRLIKDLESIGIKINFFGGQKYKVYELRNWCESCRSL
ncbi:MAG: radical SAM protein, partial [Selenomonadaceae bacterium]|nr:radical SAM protein [Selenomonadaceae bacterium]